jgi:hypothetical protein
MASGEHGGTAEDRRKGLYAHDPEKSPKTSTKAADGHCRRRRLEIRV